MTATIVRLIISLVVMLACPVIWIAILVLIHEAGYGRFTEASVGATLLTAPLAIIGWMAVWFGHIQWNGARIAKTVGVAFISIIGATAVGFMLANVTGQDEFGVIFGAMTWGLL